MTRTKTLWRFFLAHQDPHQEAWFEAQARRGWHLAAPGLFGFRFAQGEPREDRYRIDYQSLRGERRAEYLALFRDAGWDFLGAAGNRYYFRARPEALSPEIHTDPESRRDRIRRELRILLLLGGINVWNTIILGGKLARDLLASGPFRAEIAVDWIFPPALVLMVAVTVLLAWCSWKLWRALKAEG